MRAMKDSGVDWIGEIPTDWDLKKVSYVSIRSRISATDLGVVTAFRDGQVTLRANRRLDGFTEATQYHGYQRIKAGQIAVHRMDAFAGAIGVSDSDGMCSPVLTLLDCKPILNPRFLALYLREISKSGWIEALAKSVRERTSEFGWSELAAQAVVVPTLEEQNEIVSYLDHETSQIDQLIAKKEQLIEKLLERRQALITQAVTKGLDPDVPMKDSGVHWFSRIPEAYRVEKIKYVARLKTGSSLSDEEKMKFSHSGDETLPYVSSKDVDLDTRRLNLSVDLHIPSSSTKYPVAKPGSFLMVLEGGSAGRKLCMVEQPVFFVNKLCSFSGETQKIRWLYVFAQSAPFRQQFEMSLSGLIGGVSASQIGNFKLAIPNEDELDSVIEFLDREIAQIDRLVSLARKSIEVLKERRQALITQVVTGKLDVRGFSGGNS